MHLLNFKLSLHEQQFNDPRLNAKLVAVVFFMAVYSYVKWGISLVITEVWREIDAGGTHKDWRAVDIRNSSFSREQALEVAKEVNLFASYDPNRPGKLSCIVYDLDPHGNHDDHFHVQVHPNTVFKLPEGAK